MWLRRLDYRLRHITELLNKLMSKISDYTDAVNKSFDAIDTSLTGLTNNLTGVSDDVAFLKETIDKLNTNPGPISPEDQALLDAAQGRAASLATKVAGLESGLNALDAATSRPPPPTP